jgi:amino acid permease
MVRRYVSNLLITSGVLKIPAESEFWLACGKVILAVGLMAFTFVSMVGGNPLHDVYGFRNWDRTPYTRSFSPTDPNYYYLYQRQKYPGRPLRNT